MSRYNPRIVLICAAFGCTPASRVQEHRPPTAPPIETPAADEEDEEEEEAAAESETPAPAPALVDDAALGGFILEERRNGLLIRVDTIEPFGPDAEALALGFVESIPRIYACYEQHPVAGRSWLGVEVGKYGAPKSIRVHLGPGDVDPQLEACAREALASLRVPDDSSIAVFGLTVFSEAADAIALPEPAPGQRVEARYGAGCYRWIEEPPCPPRKRCQADRWELCRCPN